MMENIDAMSPESSPGVLKKTGVKRVNNLPLILVILILFVFVGLIAMVAFKRAEQTQDGLSKKEAVTTPKDSSNMAKAILAGQKIGIIPPLTPPVAKPVVNELEPTTVKKEIILPVAVIDNPDAVPLPSEKASLSEPMNEEMERIKAAKIEQFEEAVKAKTSIAFSSPTSSQPQTSADVASDRLAQVRRQLEQMKDSDQTAAYQIKLAQMQAQMQGVAQQGLASNAVTPQNRWTLNTQVEPPRTPFEIRTGAVIPGVMISGIRSELPGQIIAQVSQNVYDTATGKYLLLPQGTRLVGMYSSDVSYGQESVLVAWQRLIFPDGKALDIGEMPGADSAGYSGFRDKTNNHYVRIFGSAILMSGITAGITYSQARTQTQGVYQPTAGSALSEALGQQLGQVTAQMIAKNLNIAPNLEIRPGYRFNVIVVKDLTFDKPYRPFDY